uniref:5-formyltetrahydrofolate cyclo-ligase n=1 Tax=Soboliphyme baturini TaxID=241478 RepID=A0A183IZM2_9BILA
LLLHPAYVSGHRLSVYLSTNQEVSTTALLRNAFDAGKLCYVPCFEKGNPQMEMVRLASMDDFDALPTTLWNIKQPKDWMKRGLDVIITPGIAFTKSGKRLGHGKGYYDTYIKRYVETFKTKPQVIGLALKEQILDDLPADENDQLMDFVIYSD